VPDTNEYDLKALLGKLVEEQPNIEVVYLFGSRAYQTGSPRSDCDLLVKKPITSSKAGGLNRNRSKRFGLLGPVKQAELV